MSDAPPLATRAPSVGVRLLLPLVTAAYRAYMGFVATTSKVHRRGTDAFHRRLSAGEPTVATVLHQDLALVPYFLGGRSLLAVAPGGSWGDLGAALMEGLGFRVVQPATYSAIAQTPPLPLGLRKLVRHLLSDDQPGFACMLVADGPEGPAGAVKPGAAFLAARTGAHVYCIKIHSRRARYWKSWDRTAIPLPFSEIWIDAVGPFSVPENADGTEFETNRRSLERTLHQMHETAFTRCGVQYPTPAMNAFERSIRPASKIRGRFGAQNWTEDPS